MSNYSKCLNCQSENIASDLTLEDAGAYPAGNHKVVGKMGLGSKLKSEILGGKKGDLSSLVQAYACAECGFVALFTQDVTQLTGS